MRTNFYSVAVSVTKYLLAAVAIFLSFGIAWGTAQATVINFDDLEYVIIEDDDGDMFYEHPVTDAYLSQGLLISNGYLAEYLQTDPNIASSPNLLIGGEHFTLDFVGALPTSVGMKVRGALGQDAVFFDVYGVSGLLFQARTGGDANSPDDPAYIPGEFISFNVPEGIVSIEMSNYYGRRIVGGIDDLTFEYASVPEPSGLLLFSIGLFGFAFRKYSARKILD